MPGTSHAPDGSRCGSSSGVSIFVLVADVADDLLQQILDGDQAGHGAVLVDHDAHVLFFALHLAQQLVATLGFRHELRPDAGWWPPCACEPRRR